MSKKSIDVGSPVPLNWTTPTFNIKKAKKTGWDQATEEFSRHGTPLTTRGSFNGVMPGIQPAPPSSPKLVIKKAVLAPVKTTTTGTKPQLGRRRDEHGKFTESASAGPQTTAQDDAARAEREAKRASSRRMTKTMEGFNSFNKEQAPPQQEAMGNVPSGLPLYDDPYHPEHQDFTAEDHLSAAEMHIREAQEAMSSGDQQTAMMGQQKAGIHKELASDLASPSERAMSTLSDATAAPQPGSMPGAAEFMNPLERFLKPQHQEDQGKPLMPDRAGGPKPGMFNTRTGLPVGQQSVNQQHAGTSEQPQAIPPEPSNGSMPNIQGQGQQVQQMQAQPDQSQQMQAQPEQASQGQEAKEKFADTAPYGDISGVEDKASKDKNVKQITKSLTAWLKKYK